MFNSKYLMLLTIILLVGCGAGGGSDSPRSNPSEESFVEPSQSEIVEAINKVRSQKIDCNDGLGYVGPSQPVSWNAELYNAAYEHSNDLAMTDTFSHDGSGTEYDITGYNRGKKSFFRERIDENGYMDYDIVGENIAGGFSTLVEVVNGWLESPAHCTNIMKDDFDEIGTAIVVNPDSQYGIYWTQEFGHRESK